MDKVGEEYEFVLQNGLRARLYTRECRRKEVSGLADRLISQVAIRRAMFKSHYLVEIEIEGETVILAYLWTVKKSSIRPEWVINDLTSDLEATVNRVHFVAHNGKMYRPRDPNAEIIKSSVINATPLAITALLLAGGGRAQPEPTAEQPTQWRS